MAGDFVPESELNLKGMQKHFNSFTLRGRFNDLSEYIHKGDSKSRTFVAATYGTIFGTYFLYKIFKKKPVPEAPKSS